jgi:hypothetical protein
MAAMSIFFISIIASNARLAAAGLAINSGDSIFISKGGQLAAFVVVTRETPHFFCNIEKLSLSSPPYHELPESLPPLIRITSRKAATTPPRFSSMMKTHNGV